MKILKQSNGDIPLCIPKLVRVVRISLFLLFIVMTQLHAENLYSQNTVINLKLENATVEQVLDKIEKETEYSFLFTDKSVDIDWTVNIDIHGKSINEILEILFGRTNVEYRIVDKQIALSNRRLVTDSVNQQKKINGSDLLHLIFDDVTPFFAGKVVSVNNQKNREASKGRGILMQGNILYVMIRVSLVNSSCFISIVISYRLIITCNLLTCNFRFR